MVDVEYTGHSYTDKTIAVIPEDDPILGFLKSTGFESSITVYAYDADGWGLSDWMHEMYEEDVSGLSAAQEDALYAVYNSVMMGRCTTPMKDFVGKSIEFSDTTFKMITLEDSRYSDDEELINTVKKLDDVAAAKLADALREHTTKTGVASPQ